MALFMDGVQLPQGLNENHFEEVVYFLPLSSQKLVVLIFYQSLKRTNNANTEIWSKERSIDPYVAKMLFLQVDEGFGLYYTSFWYKNI